MELTIAQIKEMLLHANAQELSIMERSLGADTRKGVQSALQQAKRRCEAAEKEAARLRHLYEYERSLAPHTSSIIVGLDEVGRGPIAGPLAVGAVVLGQNHIEGLNDSKQVKEKDRVKIAQVIKETAQAYHVALIEPAVIDEIGMASALRQAFTQALHEVEKHVSGIEVVLVDGNPLHIDSREINVIKGDAQCASIAAASILAKVTRDALMEDYGKQYPGYGFSSNKGYGSQDHIQALKALGPCPIHRLSFCTSFLQPTLFDL